MDVHACAIVRELLHIEVARLRAAGVPAGEDSYRGLYVSDDEVDRILHEGSMASPEAPLAARRAAALDAVSKLAADRETPLGQLVALLGLGDFEAGCIVLAHASEIDGGIERLISWAQDDVTRRRPRVDLALRLLGWPGEEARHREAFAPDRPLLRYRAIVLLDEPGQPATPLMAQQIALDRRVASFLAGSDVSDERLSPHMQVWDGDSAPGGTGEWASLVVSLRQADPRPVIALHGADVARLRDAARQAAGAAGAALVDVDLPPLVEELGLREALRLADREAGIRQAAVLYRGAGSLAPGDRSALPALVMDDARLAPLSIVGAHEPLHWPGPEIPVPAPGFEERRRLWQAALGDSAPPVEVIDQLSSRFRLDTQTIADAARRAKGMARARDPASPRLRPEDLFAAARAQSAPIVGEMASRVELRHGWDDLVLPDETLTVLHELAMFVEHRQLVYETWGFGRKLANGNGIITLFAGDSGTGKTLAASVLASHLQLDLYRIDLSGVVSKYIGETEKNLQSVFEQASRSNAILFFDEADALFGKRSEVRDAHDRYANVEVAYLLQRMEEYEGVAILATNLRSNIDEAFTRRMHFVVDFPFPDERLRERLWHTLIPPEAPRQDDIDFEFLARNFRLTGGNIRNIVLAAAFLAANDGASLAMRHIIHATRREYQKLGRMVTPADFGTYLQEGGAAGGDGNSR